MAREWISNGHIGNSYQDPKTKEVVREDIKPGHSVDMTHFDREEFKKLVKDKMIVAKEEPIVPPLTQTNTNTGGQTPGEQS